MQRYAKTQQTGKTMQKKTYVCWHKKQSEWKIFHSETAGANQVKVHLQGKLQDGNISITSSDEPFTFVIDQRPREVIQGESSWVSRSFIEDDEIWRLWSSKKQEDHSSSGNTFPSFLVKSMVVFGGFRVQGLELGVQTMTKLGHSNGRIQWRTHHLQASYNQRSPDIH